MSEGFFNSTGQWQQTKTQPLNLPLAAFLLATGAPMAVFADGASAEPGTALDNSEAGGVRWNNHATPDQVMTVGLLPEDRKPGSDVTVKVVASKTGATIGDAVTFDISLFFQPVAALRDADADAGGTTDAMTGDAATKTVQSVSVAIGEADVPDGPVAFTLLAQPTDGTLGTDDVTIHAVYLEYTKIIDR